MRNSNLCGICDGTIAEPLQFKISVAESSRLLIPYYSKSTRERKWDSKDFRSLAEHSLW